MLQPTDIEKSFDRSAENAQGEYEKARWWSTIGRRQDYSMTARSIRKLTERMVFSHYLELGPGPGTWTKMFIALVPSASFDLVDISEAMLKQARTALGNAANLRYIHSNFMSCAANRTYDFFFSSRAIEYLPSKREFAGKIYSLMRVGGEGIIITKMPHYLRSALVGKAISPLHRGQIKPGALMGLLKDSGFSIKGVWPVTFHTPVISIPVLNSFLYWVFGLSQLNSVSAFFSESYAVTFTKP